MTLLLLLKTTKEYDLKSIQLFGDSMNVINWVQENTTLPQYFIAAYLREIHNLLDTFDHFSIQHVYRNKNTIADTLSKEGLNLTFGQWHFTETQGDTVRDFFP
jgi:hypothetical protein